MTEIIELVNEAEDSAFCETPTASRVLELLSYCRDYRDMGIVVGSPGVGKTTALRRYADTHTETYFCTMRSSVSSLSAALAHICAALGEYGATKSAETSQIICNRIRWTGEDAMLIIDEAQELKDTVINELRGIHDATGLPIVFCGNRDFRSRFNNTRAAAFAQFTSRVGIRLELWESSIADIETVCRHHKVQGKRAWTYLTDHAASGGLRTVSKLIAPAARIAGAGPIQLKHLKAAARLLGAEK